MPNQDEIELHRIISVIRRWWWLIVGCTLLAAVAAFVFTSSRDPIYESTTTLLVSPGQDTRMNEYNTLVAGERLALTYIEMLKGQAILEKVISQLGLQESPERLASMMQAEPVKETQLIRLTVRSSSPTQVALLANSIADIFTTHIQELQAKRYASSLADYKKEIDKILVASEETQKQIDILNAQNSTYDARLSNLKSLASDQRSDYRSLESDYEDLQLTISQLAEIVKVVEPIQAPGATGDLPLVTTALLVGRVPDRGSDAYSTVFTNEQLVQTFSEMLVGRPLLDEVIAKLELRDNPESLSGKIRVELVEGTRLIRLKVYGSDTANATLIANTIVEIFINNIKTLLEEPYVARLANMQKQLDELSAEIESTQVENDEIIADKAQVEMELARQEQLFKDQRDDYQALQQDYEQLRLVAADAAEVVTIAEPAPVPAKLVDPNRLKFSAIGAIVGALLAVGIAFLLEYTSDKIRTPDDINRLLDYPVLSTIGQLAKGDKEQVIISEPHSPNAEAFRLLAANLRYSSLEHSLRILLVTSPTTQEGKSIITANLAAALALTEMRVIAVDADLRKPRLHQIFGVEQSGGLTNSLLDGKINSRLKSAEPGGLKVLTSGEIPPNPAEILGSSRMNKLLEELKAQADMVLIDCSPILAVADTTVLAQQVDGVLIVLRANQTHGRAAIEAVESLRQVRAHIVGVVLNAAIKNKKEYYYYHYREEKKEKAPILKMLSPKTNEINRDSANQLVNDELWSVVKPLLPPEAPNGNGGRSRVSNRAALNGILYVLKTGIPWKMLPQEIGCGSGMTCWRRLRDWQEAGVWERIQRVIIEYLPSADQIDWSRATIDANNESFPEVTNSPA